MESYEVLKGAMAEVGAKRVATEMGLSTSLVYKWCEPPKEDVADDQSGARNPLDRVAQFYRITEEPCVIEWLCGIAGGVFVPDPPNVSKDDIDGTVIGNTQLMLEEFSDVLDEVSRALADDRMIDLDEAKRIRREWQSLKSRSEAFVLACESGTFTR